MVGKQKALNEQTGDDASPDATPPSEGKATEEVEEPKVEPTGKTEEEPTETEGETRKGYSKRVRELNAEKLAAEEKAQVAEEKVQSMAERLAEVTGSKEPQAGLQPTFEPQEDKPLVAPGEEIDPLEFDRRLKDREAKILRKADARAELRQKQSEALIRINSEADTVIREYPELDPDSDSFNYDLSSSITDATEAHVLANPYTASPKKFVAKMMKPYKRAVTKEVGKATGKIAKQASESALKPTAIRKGEKTAEDMTQKELEKKLGIIQA